MLAWRLAWRDLRGLSGGFRLLALALVLAVAAIAFVGSIADGLRDRARADAETTVGGDLSFRLFHRPPSATERELLEGFGRLSVTAELRPRAVRLDDGRGTLVELKAIDDVYPLYGQLVLDPPIAAGGAPADALAAVNGRHGAAVDAVLLERLDLAIGDRLRLGSLEVEIRAKLLAEPDRALRAFALGPRVIVTDQALASSGLAAPGATVYWYSRLRLSPGLEGAAVVRAVEERLPHAGWRIVDAADGIPGIERSIALGRALLLALSLAILVIGGVGIAGAVTAHLERKTATIAVLKTLGATAGFTSRLYVAQLALVALAATASGVLLGAVASLLLERLAAAWSDGLGGGPILQPAALATAALMGLGTTFLFALLPLTRAARTPPSALLRSLVESDDRRRPVLPWIAMGALGLLLAGLVVRASALPLVSLGVLFLLLAGLGFFWAWGGVVLALAGRLRKRLGHAPIFRLALANLGRPGAPTKATIAALGLGLAALSAVLTIERLADRHLAMTLPATAPDLVVIDLDPARGPAFDRFSADLPGVVRSRSVPFLHSRVLRLDGRPVHDIDVPRDVAWVIRGDRGLSWTTPEAARDFARAHANGEVALASLEAGIAARLGLGLGDRLTVDLVGRPLEVAIGALHEVDWTRLDLDFPILLAPPEEPPPHRRIAALWLAPDMATGPLIDALGTRFPAAPVIEVADVLRALEGLVRAIAAALGLATGVTLLAAALVLAGALAAGYRQRAEELAVLGLLGAVRRQRAVLGALELGLLGLAASLPASLLGGLVAGAVVTSLSPDAWRWLPAIPLVVVAGATLALGILGALLSATGEQRRAKSSGSLTRSQ